MKHITAHTKQLPQRAQEDATGFLDYLEIVFDFVLQTLSYKRQNAGTPVV